MGHCHSVAAGAGAVQPAMPSHLVCGCGMCASSEASYSRHFSMTPNLNRGKVFVTGKQHAAQLRTSQAKGTVCGCVALSVCVGNSSSVSTSKHRHHLHLQLQNCTCRQAQDRQPVQGGWQLSAASTNPFGIVRSNCTLLRPFCRCSGGSLTRSFVTHASMLCGAQYHRRDIELATTCDLLIKLAAVHSICGLAAGQQRRQLQLQLDYQLCHTAHKSSMWQSALGHHHFVVEAITDLLELVYFLWFEARQLTRAAKMLAKVGHHR